MTQARIGVETKFDLERGLALAMIIIGITGLVWIALFHP
jgi:hypothetical protein